MDTSKPNDHPQTPNPTSEQPTETPSSIFPPTTIDISKPFTPEESAHYQDLYRPSFSKAVEQQRIMAEFLREAYEKSQK